MSDKDQMTHGHWEPAGFSPRKVIAKYPGGRSSETIASGIRTAAHAHLIAAAPDLLEALIDLEDAASGLEAEIDNAGDDRLPSGCDTRGALIEARRAINKATGQHRYHRDLVI